MGFAMRVIGPDRDSEMEARLPDTKVPVLVLMGTADRLIPPEMGRHYREKLPDCHVVMVYDAAHALDAERLEAVASVIDDFLARPRKFVVSNEKGALITLRPARRASPRGHAPLSIAARGRALSR